MSGDSLYRDKPEWADVQPLELDEGAEPVVKIAYTESFKDAFGYLRAVLKTGELSERVFQLTTECIDLNPSCYTVWLLRRKLIENLKKDIHQELTFLEEQIEENQKNYQVWYHRQIMIQWLNDPTGEKEFIERMLQLDSKNYHAWQYRQWLLDTFKLYDGELDLCDRLLEEDCRNNSAWNQRYYAIEKTTGFTPEVVDREIRYTLGMIGKVSRNESPWNYLKGLLRHSTEEHRKMVVDFAESLRSGGEHNVFMYACLLNIYEKYDPSKALEVCRVLEEEDIPRKQYWVYRRKLISPDS